MRFPKERIRYAKVHEGRSDPEGFVLLDIKGLDIEGATKLVLRFADVAEARDRGMESESAAERVRALLGD